MKTVVKIFKFIGFGLFKIHLWLPILYTVAFLTIALSMGAANFWAVYFIGLVLSLLGSIALTYANAQRKINKGAYKGKSALGRKKLPEYENMPEQQAAPKNNNYFPRQIEEQYAPQPVYNQPVDRGYDAKRELYGASGAQQGYGRPAVPPGFDPRRDIYRDDYGSGTERQRPQGAMNSLYPEQAAAAPRYDQAQAAQALYPAQDYPREAIGKANAASALYPSSDKPEYQNYDRGAASQSLYAADEPANFDRYSGRQAGAAQALYPTEEQTNFDRYGGAGAADRLYSPSADSKAEYKSFSSYIQPANSMLKSNSQPTYQPYASAPTPVQTHQAQVATEYNSESPDASASPRTLTRRREVPAQIFATRTDPNVYVYEYSDRYEFIKLLEDGNKELIRTEMK